MQVTKILWRGFLLIVFCIFGPLILLGDTDPEKKVWDDSEPEETPKGKNHECT